MNSLFLAGAGVRGIMPSSEMVNNALHSCMTVRLDQHGSPLQVKVLAMTLGERTLLLAALDTLRLYKVHSDRMRQSLARATGVALEDIALCASHSHSTPILEPIGGPCSYFNFVMQQLTEAAVEACPGSTSGTNRPGRHPCCRCFFQPARASPGWWRQIHS